VYDQNELLLRAFYDLYGLQNVSYSMLLQYLRILKFDTTVYTEIQKSKQQEVVGDEHRLIDRERMAAIAKAAEDKRKNR